MAGAVQGLISIAVVRDLLAYRTFLTMKAIVSGTKSVGETLSRRTASGFVWLILQAFFNKASGLLSQLFLAWLLLPEDFGLVAIALSVAAFVNIVNYSGIGQILVHRQRRFDIWVTPAFWLSMAISGVTFFAMLLVGFAASAIYGMPEIFGLVAVLAFTTPIAAAKGIATAALQTRMDFGFLGRIGLLEATVKMAAAIIFAWLGFGPYSFVLPQPLSSILRLIISWARARPAVQMQLHFRRWKYLFRDSGVLMITGILMAVLNQGDYIILGLAASTTVVGLYFFAFRLAMQPVSIVGIQLRFVLFPAFAKIRDRVRQAQLYLEMVRLFALVTVPFAVLQIIIADPLIRLLFAPRWYEAIFVFQILSLAIAFRLISETGDSLLNAQGRFLYRLSLFAFYSPLFLVFVYFGAYFGGAIGVAWAVTLYYFIVAILNVWLVTKKYVSDFRASITIYFKPILSAFPAAMLCWVVGHTLDGIGGMGSEWLLEPRALVGQREMLVSLIKLALIIPSFSLLYCGLAFLLARNDVDGLLSRFLPSWKKRGA